MVNGLHYQPARRLYAINTLRHTVLGVGVRAIRGVAVGPATDAQPYLPDSPFIVLPSLASAADP